MMAKTQILKYFISIILCLFSISVWAQNTSAADSIAAVNKRNEVYQGTYINLDIFNPVATAWQNGRFEGSFSFDVDLWHRLFPTAEFGFMTADIKEDTYKYETIGCFAKVGANYNFINFKPDRKYDHTFYAGARYGYSYTKYSLIDAVLSNDYWDEGGKYANLNQEAHYGWFEVQLGTRVQIYKDFFMGIAVQIKTFGHFYEKSPYYPTYIAGWGKYGEDVVFGFNYTLSYRF